MSLDVGPKTDRAEVLKQRLKTLRHGASVMSSMVIPKANGEKSINRHPDYEFFLSRSNWMVAWSPRHRNTSCSLHYLYCMGPRTRSTSIVPTFRVSDYALAWYHHTKAGSWWALALSSSRLVAEHPKGFFFWFFERATRPVGFRLQMLAPLSKSFKT